jgi:hypothetical protein
MAEEINPLTGLAKATPSKNTDDINPLTGQPRSNQSQYNNNPAATINPTGYSDPITTYQKYGVALRPGVDWNEARAQRQSRTEKWLNGGAKAIVTTAGAVAENTVGFVAGIGSALYHWDASKLYDNPVGRAIDKMNHAAQGMMPNYYTKREQDAEGLASLGYANFWADKFLNGLGYAAGSIATVGLTGGAGLATRGARLLAKKAMYRGAKAASQGVSAAEAVKNIDRASRTGRALQALQMGEVGLMMSVGESSVEAREVLNRSTEHLMQERANELGVPVGQLSQADLQDIRETAAAAANVAFGLNLAVVGTTNMIGMGRILLPKYTNLRPKSSRVTRSAKTKEVIDRFADMPAWKVALERYAKEPLTSGLNEAFQEGSQFVIQEAADSIIQGKSRGHIGDWTSAIVEGYGNVLSDKEGKESVILGALIGMLTGGFASVSEYASRKDIDEKTERLVKSLDIENFTQAIQNAKLSEKGQEYAAQMEEALESGNHKLFRDAQFKLIMNQVEYHYNNGTVDLFKEMLDDAAAMEDAEFSKAFGAPLGENEKLDKVAIIKSVKDKIDLYTETREKVEMAFPPRKKQGIDRLFMSKESKLEEEGRLQDEQILRSVLMENSLNLKDADDRISNLVDEVNAAAGLQGESALNLKDFQAPLEVFEVTEEEDEKKTTSVRGLNEKTAEKLEGARKALEEKGDIDSMESIIKLQDLESLSNDRFKAASALKELMSDPAERSIALNRHIAEAELERRVSYNNDLKEKIKNARTKQELDDMSSEILTENPDSLISQDTIDAYTIALGAAVRKASALETEFNSSRRSKLVQELDALDKAEEEGKDFDAFRKKELEDHLKQRPISQEEPDVPTADEEEKEEPPAEEGDQNDEPETGTGGSTKPAGSTGRVIITTNGEYRILSNAELENVEDRDDAKGKIVVDEEGKPLEGYDSVYDKAIVDTAEMRKRLRASEVKEGDKVQLRIIPRAIKTDEGATDVVGVYENNELIAILHKNDAQGLYKAMKEQGVDEREVTVVRKKVFNTNITNTIDADGNPVFRNATEVVTSDQALGLAISRESGFDAVGTSEELATAVAEIDARDQRIAKGQVVLIVKSPTGAYVPLELSTRPIGEEGTAKVLSIIKDGLADPDLNIEDAIANIVGMTKVFTGDLKSRSATRFKVSRVGSQIFVNFNHKGKLMRMDGQSFLNLMAGDANADFSVMNVEEDSDGNVLPKLDDKANKANYRVGLVQTAQDLMYNKLKQQFDIEKLRTNRPTKGYDTYEQYATAELLQADFIALPDGHFFFDTHLEMMMGLGDAQTLTENNNPGTTNETDGSTANDSVAEEDGYDDGMGDAFSSSVDEDQPKGKPDVEKERQAVLEQYKAFPDNKYLSGQNTTPKDVFTKYVRNYLQDILTLDIETGSYDGKNLILELKAGPTIRVPMTGQNLAKGQNVFYNVDTEQVINAYFDALSNKSVPKPSAAKVAAELKNLAAETHVELIQYRPGEEKQPINPVTGLEMTEEDDSFYYNTVSGKVLKRVTSVSNPEITTSNDAALQSSSAVGTAVDSIVRDFFTQDGEINAKSYPGMPAQVFNQLKKSLENLKSQFEKRGETVLSDNITVYSDRLGIAGTVDLMTYDADGKVRLYDVKTSRQDVIKNGMQAYDKKNNTKQGKISKRQQHQRQLSLYSILLTATHNIEVAEAGVIHIKVDYNDGDAQPKSAYYEDPRMSPSPKTKNFFTAHDLLSSVQEFGDGKTYTAGLSADEVLKRLRVNRLGDAGGQRINISRAKAMLEARFGEGSVTILKQLEQVDGHDVMGYMEDGAIFLYENAEIGTEWHEGFHLFFRTLLTDEQRQQLYEEQASKAEPTQEELDAARRNLKADPRRTEPISDEEVRLLALEERMAEDLRDFMLNEEEVARTLPQKIAKFFKDLVQWIKALISDKITIRQAFSLIEKNRIPKRYSRNIGSRTAVPGRAYMIKQMAHVPHMYRELLGLMSYKVVESMEADPNVDADELLGNNAAGKESTIRNWFLRHSVMNSEGDVTTDEVFQAYKDFIEDIYSRPMTSQERQVQVQQFLDTYGLKIGIPATHASTGTPTPRRIAGNRQRGMTFLNVYNNWFDVKDRFGGVKNAGFRSELIERLRDYGITYKKGKAEEVQVIDVDAEVQKIYSKGAMEEDPAKKLSQKAKRALSRIPMKNKSGTVLGYDQFIPVMDIIREMQSITADAQSFPEMLTRLKKVSKNIPHMSEVYKFIMGLSAQEHAMLYSSLAMSMSNFSMMVIDTDQNGFKTVKMLNPAEIQYDYWISKWDSNSIGPKGVYKIVPDTGKRQLRNKNTPNKIEKLYAEVSKAGSGDAQKAALGELLWQMGIEIAPTKTLAKQNVIDAFKDLPESSFRNFIGDRVRGSIGLDFLVREFQPRERQDLKKKASQLKELELKNIFKYKRTELRAIVDRLVAPYNTTKSASFRTASGKEKFPINQKSFMSIQRDMLKSGELSERFGKKTKNKERRDVVGHRVGVAKSLATRLIDEESFQSMFDIRDLDALRVNTQTEGGRRRRSLYDNSQMEFTESLAIRLNQYLNLSGRNDVMYIAIDTQADRDRLSFIALPRWDGSAGRSQTGILDKYNLTDISENDKGIADERTLVRNVLKESLILDLHRIGKARTLIAEAAVDPAQAKKLIKGYHRGGQYKFLQTGFKEEGLLPEKYMGMAVEVSERLGSAKSLEDLIDNVQGLGELVDEVTKDFLEKRDAELQSILKELIPAGKNTTPEQAGALFINKFTDSSLSQIDDAAKIKILERFVTADMIGTMVSKEIFRGGINYTKDGADYNKRNSLITTPGIVPMMRGKFGSPSDQDYGMFEQVNEITIKDVMQSLSPEHLERLKQAMIKQGTPEDRAQQLVDNFGVDEDGVGKIETTDGQGIISVKFARAWMQGLGQWGSEHEEAWQNYQKTRRWTGPPFLPMKPSYEFLEEHDGHLIPVSHKNSYMVMTYDMVKDIPDLAMLVDRMELKDDKKGRWSFADTSLPEAHIANTISTKKLASFEPVDSKDFRALYDAPVHVLDGRGFKLPQILPDKSEKMRMTLGRQPRKHMIANIKDSTLYDLGYKTDVEGGAMKELYQSAVVQKLLLNQKKVMDEIGATAVLQAETNVDRAKALKKMIPRFRNKMKQLGAEKAYSENILQSLDLMSDGKTKLPMYFPQIEAKLNQLLFGLFRSNVYQQKVLGQEMVQFSEFGPHEKDGSLRYMDIGPDGKIIPAQVDVRTDVLDKLGINSKQPLDKINKQLREVMGYRIPQQGKSSLMVFEVRRVLDKESPLAVRVPTGTTTQMGSDFDVDKMFMMFPETELVGKKYVKVDPEYDALLSGAKDISELTEAQLNNIIFDTFKAVGTNVSHLEEILAGVETEELQAARAAIGLGKPKISYTSTITKIRTGINNMLSMALRGIYANAIAGRNVAIGSGVEFRGDRALTITQGETTLSLDRLVEKSPFTGRFTDYYISQYLSAAVDSVKDPLQGQINDNVKTADLTVYMLSMGMTPTQAVAVLNIPIMKEMVAKANKEDIDLAEVIRPYLLKYKATLDPAVQKTFFAELPGVMNFNIDRLLDMSKNQSEFSEDSDINEQETVSFLRGMLSMTEEARLVNQLYIELTPDAIDKAGTTPQHLAMLDKKVSLEQFTYGGPEALAKITQGNAYPIVKAFYQMVQDSVNVATYVGFIGLQAGVTNFKNRLKETIGIGSFNEKFHRDINRAIVHHMVTKPGSPIFESGLLDSDRAKALFMEGESHELLTGMQEKFETSNKVNIVVDSLTPKYSIAEQIDGTANVIHYLDLDRNILDSSLERNEFTATLLKMYRQPAQILGQENAEEVKNFAEAIITNLIVSTGFAAGRNSAFELIPIEIFAEDIGIREHAYQQLTDLDQPSSLVMDGFAHEFIYSYATARFGGETLFTPIVLNAADENMVDFPPTIALKSREPYHMVVAGNKRMLYKRIPGRGANGTYELVQRKHAARGLFEANLRDPDTGDKFQGSIVFDNSTAKQVTTDVLPSRRNIKNRSLLDLSKRESPVTGEAKAEKMKRAFAAAGVDVRVEFTELPDGEKGYVQGGVVYLDPNQMREDTVYHEFAHILVDMLPADQVQEYVQAAIKADPVLARKIRMTREYSDLDPVTLGKEILVTAIGLEGAKLERKKPSKLGLVVRRILRALGKLFGIKPNVAAVLAEKMYADQINTFELSGYLNPDVQKSVTLEERIKEVGDTLLISLQKQRAKLMQNPDPKKAKEADLELKNVQENIRKIKQREDEFEAFFQFSIYVQSKVDTIRRALSNMEERRGEYKNMTREEMFEMLGDLAELRETLNSLYDAKESESTVVMVEDLMRDMRVYDRDTADEGQDVISRLQESLSELRRLNARYKDVAIPLTADLLLTYAGAKLKEGFDEETINKIIQSKDISGFNRFSINNKVPEFRKLLKERKDTNMSKEEFRRRALEVKVDWMRSRGLSHRDQLVQELTEAHVSKTGFSFYLDPVVYSNENNMQLFGLALKDGIYKATETTRGFLYELEEAYDKIKAAKGSDWNEGKFNDMFLEDIEVRGMNVLSLVQPYNAKKFYAARRTMYAELKKKYNRPDYNTDAYDEWKESENENGESIIGLYYDDIARWYRDNTEKAPGAEQKIQELDEKIFELEEKIANIIDSNDMSLADELLMLKLESEELTSLRRRSVKMVDGEEVYMSGLYVPKGGTEFYGNAKYEALKADPEAFAYYEFILNRYQQNQKKIGKSQLVINDWDTFSYVMPSFRTGKLGSMQNEGWKESLKEYARDFKKLKTDQDYGDTSGQVSGDPDVEYGDEAFARMGGQDGEKIKTIPRYGTNLVDSKVVSRDIAASMAQFEHMANMFSEKGKMVGLVESMLSAHEQRRELQIDPETGVPFIDQTTLFMKDVGKRLLSTDPSESYTLKHLKEFVDSVFYGQYNLESGNILGKLDKQKLAGKVAGITAAANLSLNLLQVGNQFFLDNIMGGQEALAAQFFDKKDFGWAAKTYAMNGGAIKDVGRFVPKSKLGQAMMMFDAMNTVSDDIGRNITGSRLKKAIQGDPFFFLQHGIEHQTTGTRMLALMRSFKGKLKDADGNTITNAKGQPADVWDVLVMDEKGKLIVDPKVANFDKNAFIAKLHGINKKANQIKGSFDRAMGSRRASGKLLLLFRNYFIPGWRKRFGHGEPYHMDHEVGDLTRGSYMSFVGFLGQVGRSKELTGTWSNMTDIDKQNMRRVMYDMAWVATTYVIHSVLQAAMDDDDDSYLTAFSAYQARRLQSELLQFVMPGEALRILKSPMATTNYVEKWWDLITQLAYYEPAYALGADVEEDIFYQRKTATAKKGDRKIVTMVEKVLPAINGWQSSFLSETGAETVQEKLRWFNQ